MRKGVNDPRVAVLGWGVVTKMWRSLVSMDGYLPMDGQGCKKRSGLQGRVRIPRGRLGLQETVRTRRKGQDAKARGGGTAPGDFSGRQLAAGSLAIGRS